MYAGHVQMEQANHHAIARKYLLLSVSLMAQHLYRSPPNVSVIRHHRHRHHKHPGLDPLIHSVSRVRAARYLKH